MSKNTHIITRTLLIVLFVFVCSDARTRLLRCSAIWMTTKTMTSAPTGRRTSALPRGTSALRVRTTSYRPSLYKQTLRLEVKLLYVQHCHTKRLESCAMCWAICVNIKTFQLGEINKILTSAASMSMNSLSIIRAALWIIGEITHVLSCPVKIFVNTVLKCSFYIPALSPIFQHSFYSEWIFL